MNDATPIPEVRDPADAKVPADEVGAVVIGRNEGARLESCLASLHGKVGRLVYVDSGSTDGSVGSARACGAEVVQLDMNLPFTAARARNAGLAVLADGRAPRYVQFVDGDCTVDAGWIETAFRFLEQSPRVGVVCGRRRERDPDASVYNRLCDIEWDTPVGAAAACGGDAMMRTGAVLAAGGYSASLIAGEEPELCLRLRRAGWEVWRIDAEMTLHDAAMHSFGQWWRRCRRAGFAFAEGAARHGRAPERHWVRETRRALAWSILPPACALALWGTTAAAPLLLLVYPAQVVRLAIAFGVDRPDSWSRAFFTVLSKFPEGVGVVEFYLTRLCGSDRPIIEYK